MTNKLNFKQVFIAGLTAAAVSSVINVVFFFIFKSTGLITDDIFVQPNQPLTLPFILMASIVPSLLGSLVFFLFEKYTQNGFRMFSIIAIILMLLSLAGPFIGIPDVTTPYALSLSVMHLVVPLILLYFIYRCKKANS